MQIRETAIQWTDVTWNPATGCTKVSEGCKFCYMMRDLGGRFGKDVNGTVTRTKPGTFRKPLQWQSNGVRASDGSPLKVFTSSLTDIFHPAIDEYRNEIWDIIRKCPDLVFQILTKRPERIKEHLPADWGLGWKNVWMGCTIENQENLVKRIAALNTVPARNRFVSFEPLLGPINLHPALGNTGMSIDWAIIGGESGNETGPWGYRPMKLSWVEELLEQLGRYGVAPFVKQMGTHLQKEMDLKTRHGGNISEWPQSIQVRELPQF